MGGLQTFFGQLWKEYALSDSRYMTQDMFVFSSSIQDRRLTTSGDTISERTSSGSWFLQVSESIIEELECSLYCPVLLYNSVEASADAIRQVQELKCLKKTT
jgi:hypothetical protein